MALPVLQWFSLLLIERGGIVLIVHQAKDRRGHSSAFRKVSFSDCGQFNLDSELEMTAEWQKVTANSLLLIQCCIMVHGEKVAEVPFVGTRLHYRRHGFCRILMNGLEQAH
ncbi:hypothetical protein VNO80_20667 [Phaseolus coccineus]|uniref:Increased DNA methylation 1 C-terminal domain-containing protein n=1 Tax=Phaseolus coccineus TaxID=3886 RepID=A0AAN9M1N9_PHACN